MIVLGFVLAVVGDWALPALLPECPPRIDNLVFVIGVVLIIIGVVLLVLSLLGRSVGGRRYWY
jgi:hypothetical protein